MMSKENSMGDLRQMMAIRRAVGDMPFKGNVYPLEPNGDGIFDFGLRIRGSDTTVEDLYVYDPDVFPQEFREPPWGLSDYHRAFSDFFINWGSTGKPVFAHYREKAYPPKVMRIRNSEDVKVVVPYWSGVTNIPLFVRKADEDATIFYGGKEGLTDEEKDSVLRGETSVWGALNAYGITSGTAYGLEPHRLFAFAGNVDAYMVMPSHTSVPLLQEFQKPPLFFGQTNVWSIDHKAMRQFLRHVQPRRLNVLDGHTVLSVTPFESSDMFGWETSLRMEYATLTRGVHVAVGDVGDRAVVVNMGALGEKGAALCAGGSTKTVVSIEPGQAALVGLFPYHYRTINLSTTDRTDALILRPIDPASIIRFPGMPPAFVHGSYVG